MRQTSEEKFVTAAAAAGFTIEKLPGTYSRSVLTSGTRGTGPTLDKLKELGWERGKAECAITYSNFKGTTYWVDTPCNVVRAAKGDDCLVIGKFDNGKFVGGSDSTERYSGQATLSSIIKTMEKRTDEALAAREAMIAERDEKRRREERAQRVREFREARAYDREIIGKAVRTLVADCAEDPGVALYEVRALQDAGLLRTNYRSRLEAIAHLWARTNLHREKVSA